MHLTKAESMADIIDTTASDALCNVCGGWPVAIVTGGCVHEHIARCRVCGPCLDDLEADDMRCMPCQDDAEHECKVRIIKKELF
jgi:formate dehydrogenase maturation protein FdhE